MKEGPQSHKEYIQHLTNIIRDYLKKLGINGRDFFIEYYRDGLLYSSYKLIYQSSIVGYLYYSVRWNALCSFVCHEASVRTFTVATVDDSDLANVRGDEFPLFLARHILLHEHFLKHLPLHDNKIVIHTYSPQKIEIDEADKLFKIRILFPKKRIKRITVSVKSKGKTIKISSSIPDEMKSILNSLSQMISLASL